MLIYKQKMQDCNAMEMYLQIIRVDKNFADGAAKHTLIKLFDMINPSKPDLVRAGRRKLQMLLFKEGLA
jgi:thioredoxin-like negative regulator of GroEL